MFSDSIFLNSDIEYYLQIFSEKCKYAIKNKKIFIATNEDLELSKYDDESDDE